MKPLRKFLDLPPADRRLLLSSAALLVVARVGLWLLPAGRLRRLLARLAPAVPEAAAAVERVAWALTIARRFVPRGNCLPQALAAEALLAGSGHPVRLRLGVARGAGGRIEGHAWLEHRGRVVVGGNQAPSVYHTVPFSFIQR